MFFFIYWLSQSLQIGMSTWKSCVFSNASVSCSVLLVEYSDHVTNLLLSHSAHWRALIGSDPVCTSHGYQLILEKKILSIYENDLNHLIKSYVEKIKIKDYKDGNPSCFCDVSKSFKLRFLWGKTKPVRLLVELLLLCCLNVENIV